MEPKLNQGKNNDSRKVIDQFRINGVRSCKEYNICWNLSRMWVGRRRGQWFGSNSKRPSGYQWQWGEGWWQRQWLLEVSSDSLMFLWNFSKLLLLFFLPACCSIPHCQDPTDPPGPARKMETRKCAIFNTILFSTCLAQLEHSFCPKSFWEFPIPYLLWPVSSQNEEIHYFFLNFYMAKNLPTMQETHVWSLDWEDPWRRERQPTPVFLSGEFRGQRSLADYRPWGLKESDISERLTFTFTTFIPPRCNLVLLAFLNF